MPLNKIKGTTDCKPYRDEPADLKERKQKYSQATEAAIQQYHTRLRIINVLIASPVLLTAIFSDLRQVPLTSYVVLILPAILAFVYAKEIRDQEQAITSLKAAIEKISLEKQDKTPHAQEHNQKTVSSLDSGKSTFVLPTLIAFCMTMSGYLYSILDSKAPANLILASGIAATLATLHHAIKLKQVQDKIRSELEKLLPYIAQESNGSEVLDISGENVSDQALNSGEPHAPLDYTHIRVIVDAVPASTVDDEFARQPLSTEVLRNHK